jgi:hypothetical protein
MLVSSVTMAFMLGRGMFLWPEYANFFNTGISEGKRLENVEKASRTVVTTLKR